MKLAFRKAIISVKQKMNSQKAEAGINGRIGKCEEWAMEELAERGNLILGAFLEMFLLSWKGKEYVGLYSLLGIWGLQ